MGSISTQMQILKTQIMLVRKLITQKQSTCGKILPRKGEVQRMHTVNIQCRK